MPITWDELIDQCSRIHTRRTRSLALAVGNFRTDDARKLSVRLPDGRKATVVPTRLHEPGFYVRAFAGKTDGLPAVALNFRSPGSLRIFQEWVEAGTVEVLDEQE